MSDKLSIRSEMSAIDHKDRNFYDNLTDDERKKISPYLIMRYSSCVDGSSDLQEWYLCATNERVNKHFFDISSSKHKKLQWLMCTTASPNMGSHRHYWLSSKKKESNNKAVKFLQSLYPTAKADEIELLARLNNRDDLKDLARKYGWDEQRIKAEL